MASFIGDITAYRNTANTIGTNNKVEVKKDNSTMNMNDFLMLMVAQFQNQSIDNQTDTNDMLNQMVQMTMIEAMTNMQQATITSYAASLVGKEVTIGEYGSRGLKEFVGEVTGTGVSNGEQVIFVNGESYKLNQIMAVGRLPGNEAGSSSTPQTQEV